MLKSELAPAVRRLLIRNPQSVVFGKRAAQVDASKLWCGLGIRMRGFFEPHEIATLS
jgi:hypothetical protein